MNDADIIKALECCNQPVGSGACNKCPFDYQRQKRLAKDEQSCTNLMICNALDLINRQKAEIEEKSNKLREILPIVAELKVEAITEFAERLKLRVESIPWCECKPVQNAIDELAKEMKEGVNNA